MIFRPVGIAFVGQIFKFNGKWYHSLIWNCQVLQISYSHANVIEI